MHPQSNIENRSHRKTRAHVRLQTRAALRRGAQLTVPCAEGGLCHKQDRTVARMNWHKWRGILSSDLSLRDVCSSLNVSFQLRRKCGLRQGQVDQARIYRHLLFSSGQLSERNTFFAKAIVPTSCNTHLANCFPQGLRVSWTGTNIRRS
ncbi:unnamed protein product [Ectocarpus sp. 13 AM-2016]